MFPAQQQFLLLLLLQIHFRGAVNALLFTHEGWRIAMNIGREPGTGMPTEWASSGCRLPVVVQCDFRQGDGDGNKNKNVVVPLTGDVRFTGPDGQVVKPVEGGEWSLVNDRELSLTLAFPEELVRRDVTLDGTVRLEGLLYSVEGLKNMNDQYYEARNDRWDAGEKLNDVDRRRDAPRKWNPNAKQWEKRYENEGFISRLGKRANLLLAERKENKVNLDRPNPKDISLDCGPFPGVKGDVHFRKEGKVLLKQGFLKECLIGTWSAEPINDKPLSYY
jgi:hypothetical protein